MKSVLHEGVGVSAFLVVALLIAFVNAVLARTGAGAAEPAAAAQGPVPGTPRRKRAAGFVFALACALAAVMPLVDSRLAGNRAESASALAFPGFPSEFEGRKLVPVAMPEAEQKFFAGFPGRIGVFSDGRRTIVMRWVASTTRQLHPAADCYRGSGYKVEWLTLVSAGGARWGRIEAERDGVRLLVSERIADETGQSWSDVSAWYWDAITGRTRAPWWAVCLVERRR
jgi:hypothetical protein